VTPPKTSTVWVKGFNGTTSSTRVGTVIWNILDDSGHRRTLRIRNTYYVPACPMRILSPQHYSQQTKDLRGTYSTNYGDHVLIVWNKGKHRVTMSLSPTTNVGILRSAPGHAIFSSLVNTNDDPPPLHFCCPVVTDDKADDSSDDEEDDDATWLNDNLSPATSLEGGINTDSPRQSSTGVPESNSEAQQEQDRPSVIPFDLDHDDPATNLPSQDDSTSALDASTELLRWHH
jgi:hypothetical protein